MDDSVGQEENKSSEALECFTHFSYEASEHRLVIGSLRHVSGSLYTDPRIHTADSVGFGPGNLGREGMDDFLNNHRCGQLCEQLGLPKPNRPDAARRIQRHLYADASRRGHFRVPDVMSKKSDLLSRRL